MFIDLTMGVRISVRQSSFVPAGKVYVCVDPEQANSYVVVAARELTLIEAVKYLARSFAESAERQFLEGTPDPDGREPRGILE